MKFAAYIFAFIFTFLSVQPVFSSIALKAAKTECCTQSKCGKEEEDPTRQKDNCENRSCNPFLSCVYGNFFLLDKQFILFDFLTMPKQKLIVNNDNRIVQNLSECWHPPETYL